MDYLLRGGLQQLADLADYVLGRHYRPFLPAWQLLVTDHAIAAAADSRIGADNREVKRQQGDPDLRSATHNSRVLKVT